MKAIDIFANIAGQSVEDGHIRKYGAILLRSGGKGLAKVHPAVVWVDAAVAVIEAASAYFCYCAATEVTEQLRQYNKMLEATLAKDLQIGALELKALCKERKGRQTRIERALAVNRGQRQLTQKKVHKQLDVLRNMYRLLQEQRLHSGNFPALMSLQVCLDSSVDATLSLLLNLDGEPR